MSNELGDYRVGSFGYLARWCLGPELFRDKCLSSV